MDDVQETPGEAPTRGGSAPTESDVELAEKRLPLSRRVALLLGLAVVAVLALGWAVDGLGVFAPAVHFTNGETQPAGIYRVALTLDPAMLRAGQLERFTLAISDSNGRPVSGLRAQLRLHMVAMAMPDIVPATKATGVGAYSAIGTASMPGEWQLNVTLTPPSGSAVQTQFDLAAR